MIEEFPFTTRVLQAEEDIHSLRRLIDMHTKAVKDKLASLTWARLTWEQRVTLNKTVFVLTSIHADDPIAYYGLAKLNKSFRRPMKCETLSQMQFGGTKFPTKHVHHLHCNENCCYCDIEY